MTSKKITTILAATGIFLFVSYIYFTSTVSSIGYAIGAAEENLADLEEQRNGLIVELANFQNPENLFQNSQNLNLVEVEAFAQFIDVRSPVLGRAED